MKAPFKNMQPTIMMSSSFKKFNKTVTRIYETLHFLQLTFVLEGERVRANLHLYSHSLKLEVLRSNCVCFSKRRAAI
jgi:hypothetical protein